ncbi:MAG: helix-turn-helix transcriptional regulator [Candidatus Thorarchaeota archaeon]
MVITVITLSIAIWIWIVAMPVAREVVILATTIALAISLVLVVNIAILMLVRLQRRVDHLEGVISAPTEPQKPEVIVVTLTNTERRIINRLEENGGSLAQDELRRATGLSKSTLSVTLAGLERKSLVSRTSTGRTKMVQLERKVPR